MLFAIAILIAGGVAIFVASPLLAADGPAEATLPIDVTPATDLKRRRMVIYENLQDLDFEYKAGKIAQGDYEALRRNYLSDAAQLMLATQEHEKMSEHEAQVEREVSALRGRQKPGPAESYTCPKCGFENPLPVKFCGECGARIPSRGKNP
jgi:membrane protease subunit (stomatin/prohibitin family)